ncbi:hypothetical protein [Ruegeria atlantica]|uniref:hypothetical protein n=1 Tax=Ruegeria atlantica TaxID=81569 RepID=UPI00071D5EB9|nr:hypothetical protein [Ruegeria atlantica]
MTIGKLGVAALLALTPLTAQAQTRITPEAFLDAVLGKTVDFHDFRSGDLVGTEEFLSSTVSVWRREGRGCVYGQITTPNGQICFLYDDAVEGPAVCWWPFEYKGKLMVRLATFADSEIQEVRSITEDGLNCPSAPIS